MSVFADDAVSMPVAACRWTADMAVSSHVQWPWGHRERNRSLLRWSPYCSWWCFWQHSAVKVVKLHVDVYLYAKVVTGSGLKTMFLVSRSVSWPKIVVSSWSHSFVWDGSLPVCNRLVAPTLFRGLRNFKPSCGICPLPRNFNSSMEFRRVWEMTGD